MAVTTASDLILTATVVLGSTTTGLGVVFIVAVILEGRRMRRDHEQRMARLRAATQRDTDHLNRLLDERRNP